MAEENNMGRITIERGRYTKPQWKAILGAIKKDDACSQIDDTPDYVDFAFDPEIGGDKKDFLADIKDIARMAKSVKESALQRALNILSEEGKQIIKSNTQKKWLACLKDNYSSKFIVEEAKASADGNYKEIALVDGKKVGEWDGFTGWCYIATVNEEKKVYEYSDIKTAKNALKRFKDGHTLICKDDGDKTVYGIVYGGKPKGWSYCK